MASSGVDAHEAKRRKFTVVSMGAGSTSSEEADEHQEESGYSTMNLKELRSVHENIATQVRHHSNLTTVFLERTRAHHEKIGEICNELNFVEQLIFKSLPKERERERAK